MALFGRPVLVQIDATLTWEFSRDPETGGWIAVCRPLNLNAVGDTMGELQECANEAVMLLFRDLLATGELAAFLQRNHWRPLTPLPAAGTGRVQFDVPANWDRKARLEELIPA